MHLNNNCKSIIFALLSTFFNLNLNVICIYIAQQSTSDNLDVARLHISPRTVRTILMEHGMREHKHANNTTHTTSKLYTASKISRPRRNLFYRDQRASYNSNNAKTTLWIYAEKVISLAPSTRSLRRRVLFYFIFGSSAMSAMRLYANKTSESGAGSGVLRPSKMSACHSHAEVTRLHTTA